MKNILFITSNSLATNPRLVKEIRSCLAAGHKATVLSFSFNNWSKGLNDRLLQELGRKANLVVLPGDRTGKRQWFMSTCASLASRVLSKFFPGSLFLSAVGFSKRSWLLLAALKRQKTRFDFVIAHNPGAFVPAYSFAVKKQVPFGLDVEDYHPGEISDRAAGKRAEHVMKKVCRAATVVTFSSPLISAETEKLLAGHGMRSEVIRNVFSQKLQPVFKQLSDVPLKLIWFSQTVGLNRGIQDAVQAMNLVTTDIIRLTIVGHSNDHTKRQLAQLLVNKQHALVFLEPMHEDELMEECSRHHIGLALEPGFSLNNELALSNKLFSYLLAGNAVIASETKAQKAFLHGNKGIGRSYPVSDINQLAAILLHYSTHPSLLHSAREKAYQLALTSLNWEAESQRFLSVYGLAEAGRPHVLQEKFHFTNNK